MVTPLGMDPLQVLGRIEAGDTAAKVHSFGPTLFDCPVCAPVLDFQVQPFVSEVKTARLMNRDAHLAVAAARLALKDAGLKIGSAYLAEEIGLFGATGLAGLPLKDIAPLIQASIGTDGQFNSSRFGEAGIRAVSPILSFKILGNMPLCFVAINEGIKGPNAIYTPWEGQGPQAIESGIRAIRNGHARCALVGGCDVKTHELSFLSLQQQGVFDSWRKAGSGIVPGEGSVFLVLERETDAAARGAKIHARISGMSLRSHRKETERVLTYVETLGRLDVEGIDAIVSAGNGDPLVTVEEERALNEAGITSQKRLRPKQHVGDLFAAAAFLQVAIAAQLGGRTLVNCFGHGSEMAAFVLEKP